MKTKGMVRMTKATTVRALAVSLLLLGANVAGAQSPGSWHPSIATGREVRVHSDAFRTPVRGEWAGLANDSARVAVGNGALVAIPSRSIVRIEENQGRQRARWTVIGGAAGMLAGAVIMSATFGRGDDLAALSGFILGGMTGLIVGAPVGFIWAPERWTTHVNHNR